MTLDGAHTNAEVLGRVELRDKLKTSLAAVLTNVRVKYLKIRKIFEF